MEKVVADFSLPATGGQEFRLSSARGAALVLYFYPRDNTPGCTAETSQFRDLYPEFTRFGCIVHGISRDSLKSHENFKAKLGLPFELLSDAEELACQQFGVIKQKKLYGKDVRGIERSTFLINKIGKIVKIWREVKVNGHVDEVLEALKEIEK